MSESKFDDFPRSWFREALKALVLAPYRAAIIGARRQHDYLRFLGFRRRPVVPGYDTVGLDRIRRRAEQAGPPVPFDERAFLFVGRFVAKKNLPVLIEGYARYVALAGADARRLVLAGSGPDEPGLRAAIARLKLEGRVELTGFLDANAVTDHLRRALALVLVSHEEQWGLVVNEALALGLPAIVSTAVGSRDVLVRNLCNGHVVEPDSSEGIARAMLALAESEERWHAMVAISHERAWMADSERIADAVEFLIFSQSEDARRRLGAFAHEMGIVLK
jgi:glycosyltransferase involved in cell wall biosynthesis